MEKFTTHTGVAAALKRSAVDTDQIIPAVYLKRVTKTGFDDALFANWRQDPGFVLNQPAFASASILVAGPDFGTGSSREHAVWALRDYGFKAVLSPKFADIFRGNAGKQGLVTGVISEDDLEAVWAAIDAAPGIEMTVDLAERTAVIGDPSTGSGHRLRVRFDIDDYTRWRLLEGLDDIGLTLRNEDRIAQFEARREAWRPRTLPVR
ncbi:3-isopropylmalate dehydratase small subunit [Microbacterium sp.]|uniref:3-isopropylmalate dehydratase small subunit n=1 Tax=Microbacterium sp. TaxID=51671 RepID=UPI0028A11A27|nr:3-isopropylmalate dehydratase small subunit [Microbacterium sp.]